MSVVQRAVGTICMVIQYCGGTCTWKQVSLYSAVIFILGKPSMTREHKVFTVGWHIYSDFLQIPPWSGAIVVMTNTQLLYLLNHENLKNNVKCELLDRKNRSLTFRTEPKSRSLETEG